MVLSGYEKCLSIPIGSSDDGELTNYQIKLTLVKGSGTNLGSTIYLESESLNWPYDVRFSTDDKGTNLIDFYREEYDATDGTWVVEVPTIAASGKTYIYLHVGDADAEDASDGRATFRFYSDGSSLSGWTADTSYSVVSGEIKSSDHDNVNESRLAMPPDSFDFSNIRVDFDVRASKDETEGRNWQFGLYFYTSLKTTTFGGDDFGFARWIAYSTYKKYGIKTGNGETFGDQQSVNESVKKTFSLRKAGSTWTFFVDDVQMVQRTGDNYNPSYLGFQSYSRNADDPETFFDDLRVSNFAADEPEISAASWVGYTLFGGTWGMIS